MSREPDPITRLVRACKPDEPLPPGDPRYVNCDAVRGENAVRLIERSLRRVAPDAAQVRLFAGHRGVGKTSELLRLKDLLEKPSPPGRPFVVLHLDTMSTLDPNDLDFPDLLVFIAAEVTKQLAEARIPQFSPASTYLTKAWHDLRELLKNEVFVKEAEIGVGLAKLTLELRNRPTQRGLLREAIERVNTALLRAVSDLLRTARTAARESGKEGLVLLIDGLDKVQRRPLPGGTNTHERLFIDRSEQLAGLGAHTVYTVPIWLVYSPRCAYLEQTLGAHTVPVSMIRLRPEDGSAPVPGTAGMATMREILAARAQAAGLTIEQVFDDQGTVDYLCEQSGGHPRHLLMFVQATADSVDGLPLTRRAAEQAIRRYGNSLLREVPDEAWEALRAFAEPRRDIPKDGLHQEMLFLLYLFEYMNGTPWYEVNPVLRGLDRFAGSVAT